MVEVNFFGVFSISCGDKKLSLNQERAKQVFLLLEYLLVHRSQDISSERICGALWSDGSSDNPSGALKNLVYRLRGMLGEIGRTPENEYIISRRGNYAWNNSIDTYLDIEDFEELYAIGENKKMPMDSRIKSYIKAIDLYKGDFLNADNYEEWVVPICEYYRNMFFECVLKSCDYLMSVGDYAQVEIITTKAIKIDPFEEKIQLLKMNALILQGKYTQALAHYEYVTGLYYNELGVKPSEEIRSMYKCIAKQIKSIEIDLGIIKSDLQEAVADTSGAFCCDYEVFKNMYRLEARTVERSGQSVFVGLFSLSPLTSREISKTNRERAMECLKDSLLHSLRKGDVISRFSVTQYVSLLPTVTFENSSVVTQRVQKRFESLFKNRTVGVSTKVMPIDPIV